MPTLVAAVRAAPFPPKTPVFVGSYGISPKIADQVHALPGARYAPMFHIQPGWFWERRRLDAEAERKVVAKNPQARKLGGAIPALSELLRLPTATRIAWSVELGARFRDALRAEPVAETWQLDEIVAETAGTQGRPYRELTRGVLRGLTFGRAVLGDRSRPGLVWWAKNARGLPSQAITPELSAFWKMLDRACIHLIGEEYPDFAGDPRRAAGTAAVAHDSLRNGGPVRQKIARKYAAGLTPGFRLEPGLGGNTRGLPRAEAERWRASYLRARADEGVSGFAEFDFRYENSGAAVVRELMRQLAAVV